MSWMLSCIGCGTKKLPEREESRFLDYQHCLLKTVPYEVFQNERILQELILDSNQISDLPRELFHCHELCILSISDNELQNLPVAVSSLVNLQSLNFCKNGISDIPDSIKGCKKLYRLDASTNPLCRVPEGVTQLVALRELCLNDTFLDYLPANFGRLTGLEVLELRENQLNTLPRSMTRLTALRRLDLGQNEYSELPEVVGHLTSLTDLWFDGNKIKCIPMYVGNLSEVHFIDASRNRIREISLEIGSCKNLADLYLNYNELENLPEEICKCKHLKSLSLDENMIGQLPQNLGELDQLTELNVSHNELIELPSSIGLLRELRVLHVDHNLLAELPAEIGSCSQLIILTAAHNKITSLPPELANISRLRVINACGNQIEFLPVSFTKLQVTGLWLSENQTKPTVPMQCKIDSPSGQKVLTCYMLPQQPYEEKVYKDDSSDWPVAEADFNARRAKSLIQFATDKDREEPGLARIPTPYPKELRALARHTKNLKLLSKVSNINQNDMVPTIRPVNQSEMVPAISPVNTKQDVNKKNQEMSLIKSEEMEVIIATTEVNDLAADELIETSIEKEISDERSNFNIPKNETFIISKDDTFIISDSESNNNHNNGEISELKQTDLSLENIEPINMEDEIQPHAWNTEPLHQQRFPDLGINSSFQSKEMNLSFARPASIAAPERSNLEQTLENNYITSQQKVSWQYKRPGSLATPCSNNEVKNLRNIPLTHLSLATDKDVIPVKSTDDQSDTFSRPLNNQTNTQNNDTSYQYENSTKPIDSKYFTYDGDSTVNNNQTKILYSSSNSSPNQYNPQKVMPSGDFSSPKSPNTKVAFQSKLPTLGTPNKNIPLHPTLEASDEMSKTRIPVVSPGGKSIKSPQENFGNSQRNENKINLESPFTVESRIPSYSAKHSTFPISPVQKPINTTGIPTISSPSRDSITNSSQKKKSGIPLSKSKQVGHQVTPTEIKLKSPRANENQAWK